MAIQDDNTILNKGDLKAYHERIAPMLGGTFMVSTNNSEHYSTDEKVVGVWTDGKPIYQRTITRTLKNGSGNIESSGITDIDVIVDEQAMFYRNWSGTSTPADYCAPNYFNSSAYYSFGFRKNGDFFYNNPANSTGNITVTVKYTKTTDTAGSAVATPGAYDINFPNTWPENTEIYFGNGLYGIRATGSHTTTTSRYDAQLLQWTNGVEIVSYGGHIYPDNTTWNIQIPYTWTEGGSNYLAYIYGNNDPTHPSWNGIMLYLKSNVNLTAKWDVWVTYKK